MPNATAESEAKSAVKMIAIPIHHHKTLSKLAIDLELSRKKVIARALEIGLAALKAEALSAS